MQAYPSYAKLSNTLVQILWLKVFAGVKRSSLLLRQTFYNIGPLVDVDKAECLTVKLLELLSKILGQMLKTFYGRHLLAWVFVLGSIKAAAYPSEAPFRWSTLG